MNIRPRAAAVQALSGAGAGVTEADFVFALGGGKTFLLRQFAPYPFHVARPHRLDAARPDLATLYLQSASGGLYRGDRLGLAVETRPGAAAHVTSQAATVVHRSTGDRIRMTTRLVVHPESLLALTTDPYVLFPDTALKVETECVIHPGARGLLAEGFAVHDPSGAAHPFATLETASRIRKPDGRTLAEDRSTFTGEDFDGSGGPLGGWRALGSVLILGGAIDPATLERRLDAIGVLGGASPLPNDAGWGVRLLARDGGSLARGLELAFAAGFEALAGCVPARRRK